MVLITFDHPVGSAVSCTTTWLTNAARLRIARGGRGAEEALSGLVPKGLCDLAKWCWAFSHQECLGRC